MVTKEQRELKQFYFTLKWLKICNVMKLQCIFEYIKKRWYREKYCSLSLDADIGRALRTSVSSNFKPVFHVDAKGYFASCRVLKDLGLRWPRGDPEMEYNQHRSSTETENIGAGGKMCNS